MEQKYPFSALVGQEKMKLSLILAVINPALGGVLIRGEKGTAKSTAVRSLASLLPEQEVIEDCLFGCDPDNYEMWCFACKSLTVKTTKMRKCPLVELPIGATEDRLLGSINLEKAITLGKNKFEPGLLAAANRGILYVDEVNLLDDHLVDSLLDAAAMGRNIVEREGISVSHPSSFTLVGTMNPEEGELRPQLLDRFGLCVEVKGLEDPTLRQQVVRRRLDMERNSEKFNQGYNLVEKELGKKIEAAREKLSQIQLSDEMVETAVHICLTLGVDGHRGDLTVIKTALTLAAWKDKLSVSKEEIIEGAELALPHRMRRKPFQDVDFNVKTRLQELEIQKD